MNKLRKAVVAAVTGVGVMTAATAVPAQAGVVPNMFWRTCTWSCSPFVQSNGPYNPNYISQCNTKNWLGRVTSTYYIWGRC
jgi:hypothetical protein